MFYIACTRFNNETYNENVSYRKKHNEIVIYGTSTKIRHIYPIGSLIFVVEMNNETNKIEGIGLIRNQLVNDGYKKIYNNSDYNRYYYKGKYWLSREDILQINDEIVTILENILFKGKSNLKRFSGITILTKKLFTNWNYELNILQKQIKELFILFLEKREQNICSSEEHSQLVIIESLDI
jgi:hypothetical protein